jgi:hypothetical protein
MPTMKDVSWSGFTEVTIAVDMERIPDDYVSQTLFSLQALRSLSLYAHTAPVRYDFGFEITVYQGSQGLCCTSRKREPL